MNTRLIHSLLCSLCMHLAGLGLFFHGGVVEYGVARSKKSLVAQSPLAVRIVTGTTVQRDIRTQGLPETRHVTEPEFSLEKIPVQEPAQTIERADNHAAPASPSETNEIDTSAGLASDTMADQDYLPAGRLTRLPAPLSHVDLNVAAINQIAFAGKIELTVLIDASGRVADVISSIESEEGRAFAEHVAARFKSSRFSPGEVNGKAVKSQLQITVVSERPPIPGK